MTIAMYILACVVVWLVLMVIAAIKPRRSNRYTHKIKRRRIKRRG